MNPSNTVSSEAPVTVPLPGAIDPVVIARRLAETCDDWFWLDGAAAPAGEARRSYLGLAAEVRRAAPGSESAFLNGLLVGETATGTPAIATEIAHPGFTSGWVVALSYEFGLGLMGAPAKTPELYAVALRCDAVLVIDHDAGRAEVRGTRDAVSDWLAWHAEGSLMPGRREAPGPSPVRIRHSGETRWRQDDATYASAVETCRSAIHEGDAYVLCLTDTAQTGDDLEGSSDGGFEPLELYLALRRGGAAARGGVLCARDGALVSASPERFLSVRGDSISTHPIKGTRPRSMDEAKDQELAAELAADPKERAENLMIVDLMRNDLSQVCEPGTVRVDGFLRVETHRHVHQLVSTVSGNLRPDAGIVEALGAAFPGGSMTGAPKRRAVEILAELEAGPRGLYAGCFGWIDANGDAELAMTIRSIELSTPRGRASYGMARVGAGGGVTADSDPWREVAEKHLKAAAALAALAAGGAQSS